MGEDGLAVSHVPAHGPLRSNVSLQFSISPHEGFDMAW